MVLRTGMSGAGQSAAPQMMLVSLKLCLIQFRWIITLIQQEYTAQDIRMAAL